MTSFRTISSLLILVVLQPFLCSSHVIAAEQASIDFSTGVEVHQPEPQTFPGVPDNFPEFEIPQAFTVMGGTALYGTRRLMLETRLTPAEAVSALSSAILSAGFSDFRSLAGRALNEFIVSEKTRYQRRFCRDDVAYLTLEITPSRNMSEVTLSSIGGESMSHFVSYLDEAERARAPGFSIDRGERRAMMQLAPVLDIPANATVTRPPVVGNPSTSIYTYVTDADFTSEMNIDQLFQLFNDQIKDQSWALDSQSIGSFGGSSSWLSYPLDGYPVYVDFNIVQLSESEYSLRMRVTRLGGGL